MTTFSARSALFKSTVLLMVCLWVNFFGLAIYRASVLNALQDRRSSDKASFGVKTPSSSTDDTVLNRMVRCQNELSFLVGESRSSSRTFHLTQETADGVIAIVERLPEEWTYWDLLMAELTPSRLQTSTKRLCQDLRNLLDQNEQEQEHAETSSTVTVVIEQGEAAPSTTTSDLLLQSLRIQGSEALTSFFKSVAGDDERRQISLRGAVQNQN